MASLASVASWASQFLLIGQAEGIEKRTHATWACRALVLRWGFGRMAGLFGLGVFLGFGGLFGIGGLMGICVSPIYFL